MIIDDFLEKKDRQQLSLLHQLLRSKGSLPPLVLKEKLGLSKQALDNSLSELTSTLQSLDTQTALTRSNEQIHLSLDATFDIKIIYAHFLKGSLKFQILDYALEHPSFSITKMSHHLAISEATLFRKIKDVNGLISEFGVKIKNGDLQGEELQIRYLYFQLYSLGKTSQERQEINSQTNYVHLIAAFEKTFECQLSDFNHFRLSLWLHVSKKRQRGKDLLAHELTNLLVPFKTDPLYLKTRQLTLLLTSRFAIEVKEEESMLHFAFLMSMSIFPETFFTAYDLIRNRRSPISQADTWVRESILFFYQPRKPSISLENQLNYFLSNIHSQLYFLKGALLPPFPYQKKKGADTYADQLVTPNLGRELLTHVLASFGKEVSQIATLERVTLDTYKHLLALIDMKISHPIHVGIDLWVPLLEKELLIHDMKMRLTQIAGVTVSPYQKGQSFDIILTTMDGQEHYLGQPKIFSAPDWSHSYHMEQVERWIYDQQFHK